MSETSMDKIATMGRTSATGSLKLFIGKIISTVILAIGTIIVGRYISAGDYGLYTIAMVPAATFLLFQDWGISDALTKYCANYRASKREAELRSIILSGLIFMILTGLALTLLSLLAANFLASIFGKPGSAFLIAVSSITIFFTALSGFSISVIVGFERMGISSITAIISATVQGLLSPFLVYLGFGAFGAVVGFTAASVTSGVTGLVLLYFFILRKLPSDTTLSKAKIVQTLKLLLNYGVPLSIVVLLGGALVQIQNLAIASFVDVAIIGNFTIAVNFSVLISFFTLPLRTVLFPAFSKLDPLRDKQLLQPVYASSIKYSSLFLVPVITTLMILSAHVVDTLYGDRWIYAPLFLTLNVSGYFVVLLGSLSYNRFLYAMGETKILLKLSGLTLCIGIPLSLLLIPNFGVLGAIISNSLIAPSFSLIIGIYWTWKHYEIKMDFGNSVRILLASTIAGLTTYLFINTVDAVSWILLITGTVLFLIVYLISVPLIGAVNKTDIRNLRFMFSEMGIVAKFLEIPLTLFEKLLRIKEKSHLRLSKKDKSAIS
jgi:O-antigen/teichoic acid export membrane protein